MYKDKEKQKEANKDASQRRRDKAKGMTQEGMTAGGMMGKSSTPILHLDNGSYIHINKLVDNKWRSLLTYLSENLVYQDNIRVGVAGPTIKECKKLLEVTA